ncbi:MAG: MFS transporter [Thermodesulfobacteriota bacterium]
MNRRVYLSLFVTIMATALGASLVVPLLPVYAQELGAGGLELGLIFSAFAFARTVFLPLVGRLADTWGRRNFMLWGLFSYTVVSFGFSFSRQAVHLVLCRLFQGAGAAMVIPLARAYVGEMAPPGEEGRVMGHFNMAFFAGLSLGPWLGGVLKDILGIDFAFYAMGGLALFGLVLAWANLPHSRRVAPEMETRPRGSYAGLLRHRGLLALLIFRFGIIIGLGMNWTFMPLFSDNLLHLSAGQIGILISLNVVMTTLLQPWFGRWSDRVSRSGLTAIGGVMASLSLMGVPFCGSFWQLFGVNLAAGVASGVYMPPLMAMAVRFGRETGGMTQVMSLLEMSFSLGMVIGPIMAGLINQSYGLRPIFWAGGGLGLLATLAFFYLAAWGGSWGPGSPQGTLKNDS